MPLYEESFNDLNTALTSVCGQVRTFVDKVQDLCEDESIVEDGSEILSLLATIYNAKEPKKGKLPDLCIIPLSIAFAVEAQKDQGLEPSREGIVVEVARTVYGSQSAVDGRTCMEGGWAEKLVEQSDSLIKACTLLERAVKRHAGLLPFDEELDVGSEAEECLSIRSKGKERAH